MPEPTIHERIAALELAESEGPYEAIDTRKLDELRADRNEAIRDAAVAFVERVGDGNPGVGRALTCGEFAALQDLYRAVNAPQSDLVGLTEDHAAGDDDPSDCSYDAYRTLR